jgi:acyl-coenzyme A synthetase/AMP-(fatty) acid ligase
VDQDVELGDPAMIIYTSGTTGPPKVNKRVEVQGKEQGEEMDQEVELGDPAMIIYTIGTTGPPKINRRMEV